VVKDLPMALGTVAQRAALKWQYAAPSQDHPCTTALLTFDFEVLPFARDSMPYAVVTLPGMVKVVGIAPELDVRE
jgi:hypothetical protein